ncbi:hypothetical protein [Hyalangium rubrum]|uniref:Outer membrane protein beta-barrel domain-containing protein n=1 Tax=Hyalangium rubrum TaxID=3103134 RepID=A0ABU5HFT4_9BACT|nr:hypothetical protein [Hyalangium sp. s54d21]MDY7232111.1 hypothetical protein [Hyalangium sp. s54d21]
MRAAVTLGVAGLLLGGTAAAQPSEVTRRTQDPERLAPLGLLLDAGVPGGAGLSAAFRPSRHVRLHVGATHNGIRLGGRAGLTLLPLKGWLTPSASFEVGHALCGDVEKLTRRMADTSLPPTPSMERVGYSYASTHLGIEFGRPERYMFFLRGGLSWVQVDVPDVRGMAEPFLERLGTEGAQGGRFYYTMPSAKLGFIVYFG